MAVKKTVIKKKTAKKAVKTVAKKAVKREIDAKNLAVFSVKSPTQGKMAFPEVLKEKDNLSLLAQAVRVYTDREHPGNSKVKTRAEVNKTGAKVYRQKHTGNARHGSRSAPIYVGGGVAHGPKSVKRELTLSTKMRKKALLVMLSMKARLGKVVLGSDFGKISKTGEAQKFLDKVSDNKGTVLVGLSEVNKSKYIYFRNIPNVNVQPFSDFSVLDVYRASMIVLEKEVFEAKKVKNK